MITSGLCDCCHNEVCKVDPGVLPSASSWMMLEVVVNEREERTID